MSKQTLHARYVLGLDIGVASIGWALINLNKAGKPGKIIRSGAHTFDAGVEGNIETGRDEARGTARREARLPRRMHERRQRRKQKLLRLLQKAGLLPPGETGSPQAIHEYLLRVDTELRARHPSSGDRVAAHLLPYRLRTKALSEPLQPHDLGRALYHLAQRRGFLSNRKSRPKADEDEGTVKKGISDLQASLDAVRARTLGEYFAGLDPEEERIRNRWTSRQMYLDEFDAIWNAQARHHPNILTRELRKQLHAAVFFQRPLKSQRHLIGRCELEPNARRAALGDRLAQQFRILQKVNDLTVRPPGESERHLDKTERCKLLHALWQRGDLTFAQIRSKKVLGLPKGTTFNLEEDDEKKMPGHRTDERMRRVFGDRWDKMSHDERDSVVLDILSFQNEDALARRAKRAWGLSDDDAQALAETRLEQGYAAHSRRALRRLVQCMQDGTSYATARKRLYPESSVAGEPADRLPPVLKALPELRNPGVTRALTELRKLVNEIVRLHGKPERIHVELGRDLKRSRAQRQKKTREADLNAKLREDAKARILAELRITQPSRSDVQKVLLADECAWECPYTGRQISMRTLLGPEPQFDVEHILPLGRSLDNSFVNKTLCYHQENRQRKRNHTPYEAYANDLQRYGEILERVRRFGGRIGRAKLRRFEMTEIPEGFVTRQLNDTRYASRLAGDYLGLLYGGRTDEKRTQRIQVSSGGITAHLRSQWDLHAILSDGGRKTRDDHRHHAVDAIAVALSSPAVVRELQSAAERASAQRRRLFAQIAEPWPGFLTKARDNVRAVNVSRRTKRRVGGVLHAESLYSKPKPGPHGEPRRHIRKALDSLSPTDLRNGTIVDPVVRAVVTKHWEEAGRGKPERVFQDPESHPTITTGDGREVPVHKVRVVAHVKPRSIAKGCRKRHITSKGGSNHHTVIVAVKDNNGRARWEDHLATRLDVYARLSAGAPAVCRDWGPGCSFKFSLAPDEYVLMDDRDGQPQLYRVASISQGDLEFRLHCDARTRDEIKKAKARVRGGAEVLRKRNARKVRVTYLGDIVPAND